MIFLYRVLINIVFILSPLIILFRLIKRKEDLKRFKEKFCFFSKNRKHGKLIWFHGASVGELQSIVPLLEKLDKDFKIKQILVTSNTLSSSKVLSNLKLKKTIHQFYPIDTNLHSQNFLKYWRPSMAIFLDSEIWPNMIYNIKKKKISLILLNARITKKSFKRWKFFSSNAKIIFQKFDICLSASLKSKTYLKSLGAKNIKYIGNLKFSQTEKNEYLLNDNLKKFFNTKKIWCSASTHNTEENLTALAHKKLKLKYKNLLTIIIPRHINRTDSILQKIQKLNLKIHLDNSHKIPPKETDIYLVNSYGKTKSFFKICKTVFLGGSMIKHGGQNPLEPARYGCTILHGPYVWNFEEIYGLLERYKVSQKISNLDQLVNKMNLIFRNKTNSQNIEYKIKSLGNKILNLTLKEINYYIKINEN